jgi:hypothetical protein
LHIQVAELRVQIRRDHSLGRPMPRPVAALWTDAAATARQVQYSAIDVQPAAIKGAAVLIAA